MPATADTYLQRDLLKGEWGFEGFVVTDWGSLVEMVPHGFAADNREAAMQAINAGVDMEMETGAYVTHLKELVEAGEVDEALIDDAVRRVLRVKHELGLFEDPYRYLTPEREASLLEAPEHLAAARRAAERSMVLLKNDTGLLPLTGEERIAVIGAFAEDKEAPLGNWRARGRKASAVSVLEGLREAGVAFDYAKGADVDLNMPDPATVQQYNETDRSGFDEAVALAAAADTVILVVGEPAMASGEGRSRAHLGLPGVQEDLVRAIHAANPNIILVVMSGRPLILTWADENVPTILQAWHLGSQSGHAITSVLTGAYNPGGKLPMTFPRSMGQVPIYYNRLNTGRPGPRDDVWWSHYTDEQNTPLYPFGHGLSYTTFAYSDLIVTPSAGRIDVAVTLTNTGDRQGEEVAQLYIWDKVASVVRPIRELKGFEKVSLDAGDSKRVTFTLTEDHLGFYNASGTYVVEPGTFEIFVGGSSDAQLSQTVSWSPAN